MVAQQAAGVQPADLEYGRAQVEQFIKDRPDAGAVLNSHPALKEQIAILFADDGQGDNGKVEHVQWEKHHSVSAAQEPAVHHMSVRGGPARAWVTHEPECSPIDKCVGLIFELENAQNDRHLIAIGMMIATNQISKEDYVRSTVHDEFNADKRTKELLLKYPIGHVNAEKNPGYASTVVNLPNEFSDYLKLVESYDGGRRYLQYYRDQYDRLASKLKRK